MYDTKQEPWVELKNQPSLCQGRFAHSCCSLKNTAYVFGGVDGDKKALRSLEQHSYQQEQG